MINKDHLERYLERVTQQFGVREAHAILMRFMCRCLLLIQGFLPDTGRNALDVAKTFWFEGGGQAEELLAARVSCWNYLDAKDRSIEIQSKEDAAMRAVICVLYAEPQSDDFSAETVRWFAAMFDRLDSSHEITQLMEE